MTPLMRYYDPGPVVCTCGPGVGGPEVVNFIFYILLFFLSDYKDHDIIGTPCPDHMTKVLG